MSLKKKIAIASAAIVVSLGVAVVALPRILFGDGVDYSHVASIRGTEAFQDDALLARAWALPNASRYREVDWQKNGGFCGPTSVVNVMRSRGEAADQDTILDGTETPLVLGLLVGGVTLEQLAHIARVKMPGTHVEILRDLDLASFREHMRRSNDPSRRYIVNFHRGPLFGTGGGHYSPIGGYLEDEDLVFVIDVNEDYKPWLVSSERLFAAIDTVDPSSHRKRGLLSIE